MYLELNVREKHTFPYSFNRSFHFPQRFIKCSQIIRLFNRDTSKVKTRTNKTKCRTQYSRIISTGTELGCFFNQFIQKWSPVFPNADFGFGWLPIRVKTFNDFSLLFGCTVCIGHRSRNTGSKENIIALDQSIINDLTFKWQQDCFNVCWQWHIAQHVLERLSQGQDTIDFVITNKNSVLLQYTVNEKIACHKILPPRNNCKFVR